MNPLSIFDDNPWDKPCLNMWPISTFTLKRNLKKEPFPHKQTAEQAKQVLEEISTALKKCPLLQDMKALSLDTLTPETKEALFLHIFLEIDNYEDRPQQMIFYNITKTLWIGINVDNHLCLHALDYRNDWFATWSQLVAIDSFFTKELDYAFSTRFGFLTKHIQECGSGLCARAYLHAPVLSDNTSLVDSLESKLESTETGLCKSNSPGLLVLKNKYNLGFNEETLIKSVQEKGKELMEQERALRAALSQETSFLLQKHISSSLGVLLFGKHLSYKERQSALSYLKLGVDLKWVTGIADETLNHMIQQQSDPGYLEKIQPTLKNITLAF